MRGHEKDVSIPPCLSLQGSSCRLQLLQQKRQPGLVALLLPVWGCCHINRQVEDRQIQLPKHSFLLEFTFPNCEKRGQGPVAAELYVAAAHTPHFCLHRGDVLVEKGKGCHPRAVPSLGSEASEQHGPTGSPGCELFPTLCNHCLLQCCWAP